MLNRTSERIAEYVRSELGLTLPISLEKLKEGIEKAQGRCIEIQGLPEDAKYRILNQENLKFEILYAKEQPKESQLFAITRELGKVLLDAGD